MTINKPQGPSLEHVGIDLRNPVFTHGQLYTLSGSTRVETIHVLYDRNSTNDPAQSIVYPELLL